MLDRPRPKYAKSKIKLLLVILFGALLIKGISYSIQRSRRNAIQAEGDLIRANLQGVTSDIQYTKFLIKKIKEDITQSKSLAAKQIELSMSYQTITERLSRRIQLQEKILIEAKNSFNLSIFEDLPASSFLDTKPTLQISAGSHENRKDQVRMEFLFAWNSYKAHAWGRDELRPITKTYSDWLGLGVTIVDALDTLWIMGLKDQFKEARDWVATHLDFDKDKEVSFFETTIRELGGLLSAFELSRDRMFLQKAEELAPRLLKAFHGLIPYSSVNLHTGVAEIPKWNRGASVLSEIGTVQMEFLYLAYHTGNPNYALQALEVYKILDGMQKVIPGLYPVYVSAKDPHNIEFTTKTYSLGALGDSFYEYLLKLWLLTDKQADGYKRMYAESVEGIINTLVQKSPSGFTYVTQSRGNGMLDGTMEHLTCFSGGMFALGSVMQSVPDPERDLELGANITRTCYEAYHRTATRLGSEQITMAGANELNPSPNGKHYLLRPEVVESYFILWRTTKDPKYREWAWEAFQALVKHCRTEGGYSGLKNVEFTGQAGLETHDNLQQSFFLAETLKYLYLIFCDDDVIPLDDFVFNTEAHPLGKIREPISSWPRQLVNALILS